MVAALLQRHMSSFPSPHSYQEKFSVDERGMANNDDISQSSSDKKRNKLGYHRTAVACGHCRRRKIRCIQADSSSQRCQNCIRLKKDCQFFPVDQAAQASTKRKGSESKGDGLKAESETSVSSSSPGLQTGPMDPYDSYRAQIESPSLARGGPQYPPLGSPSAVPGSSDDYEYQQQLHQPQWSQPAGGPRFYNESHHNDDAHGHSYWPPSEQSGQGPYSGPAYSMSTSASAAGLTSTDHPYSPFSPNTQGYQYSPQSARVEGMQSGRPMQPYGIYRSSTMPDSRDDHGPMNIQPQSLMSSPYSATTPQGQFPPTAGMASRWPEPTQMTTGYPAPGNQQWFSPGLNGRDDNNNSAHMLSTQHSAPNQFRTNPG